MSDLPNRPLARIIRAEHADSWIDGYAFLQRATEEAAVIRAGAEAEVAKAREAGRAEGRLAGEAEAACLLTRTQGEVDRYLASVEPRMADLALAIVRQVLDSFDDADLVARAARHALQAFREEEGVVVHVAPDLVAQVDGHLRREGSAVPAIRVAPDRHLTGRQCIVTTPAASIDVGIDAQLEAIRETMMPAARSAA